jgi:GNAT superfamily N-acetyltransferase
MPVTYRPATLDDSYTVYQIFQQTILDFGRRTGVMAITGGDDPAIMENLWKRRRPLFEHLARTAEHFWLAENDGEAVGYARSILRDGARELTEFFVLPGKQSAGVGRELLARAFPFDGARHRSIVATTDSRAQARYLKAGVYARFPIYYFGRKPEAVTVPTDLAFEPMTDTPETFDAVSAVDVALLGHRRDIDHAFLMEDRNGFLCRRGGEVVGYCYTGDRNGPIALLNEGDFPATLGFAENQAATRGGGDGETGFEVPGVNRAAVDYLLKRGYQMDSFIALFMSDEPPGRFENYICVSPPFFI